MARLSPEAVAAEAAFTYSVADIERILGKGAILKLKSDNWIAIGDEAITLAQKVLSTQPHPNAATAPIQEAYRSGSLTQVVGYMLQRDPTIATDKIVEIVLLAADLINTFHIQPVAIG